MEIARPVGDERGGRELVHEVVQHAYQLVGFHVLDAAADAIHEDPQLAAEDRRGGLGLGVARLEGVRDGADCHHHPGAAGAQSGERAADAELDVIRMRAKRDHRATGVAGRERARDRL
jgi:hypothetical protein